MSTLKKIIKSFIPPIVLNFYSNITNPYGFSGEYKNWEIAQKLSSGYDSKIILEKTKNSLLKVKNCEAAYERDSFLFDKVQYSWALLASLLYIASTNENQLKLLDFGGSLGSSYVQNRFFLSSLKEVHWDILEQPATAECGQKYFIDEHLKFYSQIEEYLNENSPKVVLFSASLQYLSKPYQTLDLLIQKKTEFILFDRLLVTDSRDMITIQNVDPIIYEASYPLWIFNEENILNYLIKNNYELLTDFDSLGGNFSIKKTGVKGQHKGYLFKLKNSHV